MILPLALSKGSSFWVNATVPRKLVISVFSATSAVGTVAP